MERRNLTKVERKLFKLIKGEKFADNDTTMQRDMNGIRNLLSRSLPKHLFNINCYNEDGCTPLIFAVKESAHDDESRYGVSDDEDRSILEVVSILLEYGADANLQHGKDDYVRFGCTALHFASQFSFKIVELLLSKGANPNLPNYCDTTPLLVASRKQNHNVIKALLESGADVHSKDASDSSQLHLIFLTNIIGCLRLAAPGVQLLLQYGADVNVQNVYGMTPLYMAAARVCPISDSKMDDEDEDENEDYYYQQKDLVVICQLLDANADLSLPCHEGNTPLHGVVESGVTNLVKLF